MKKIQPDKIKHAIAGAIIAIISFFLFNHLAGEAISGLIAGIGLSSSAGFAKEMFDSFQGRNWSWADFGFTAVAGAIVSIILFLIF